MPWTVQREKPPNLPRFHWGVAAAANCVDLNAVHLKMERGAETFGLRPGSVDVFNSVVNDFESVGDW
jgi:hypothetical protein